MKITDSVGTGSKPDLKTRFMKILKKHAIMYLDFSQQIFVSAHTNFC